jgi:cell division protein FtsQ
MLVRLSRWRLGRAELLLSIALIGAAGLYGAVRGGHVDAMTAALHETGDAIASHSGFRIKDVQIHGAEQVAHADLLQHAGITENTSLLFLDVDVLRAQLKTMPWIAGASVRKLYPDRLDIFVEERAPFARWQREGRLHLISRDGTVLESDVGLRRSELPLVVGAGAEKQAAAFLNLIERFPAIRAELRAGVFVAERRWNLRLNNGVDVRLPEEDPAHALQRLVELDREKRILSRDVTVIDLRFPHKTAVTLSDEAAEARRRPARRDGADS